MEKENHTGSIRRPKKIYIDNGIFFLFLVVLYCIL